MELKMVHNLISQVMNLMGLIPWSDDIDTDGSNLSIIYPGVDEELQAAYEHLDDAMGVLQSPLAAIEEMKARPPNLK